MAIIRRQCGETSRRGGVKERIKNHPFAFQENEKGVRVARPRAQNEKGVMTLFTHSLDYTENY